jgi:hypothetical protein
LRKPTVARTLSIAAITLAVGAAAGGASLGVAWRQAVPSHERAWQDGQERIPVIRVTGDSVHIENLRDSRHFPDGISETRWIDGSFRISEVERIWFALSPFNPRIRALAHPFLSFEMSDGRFVVVSVEARREQGRTYSALRGLFPSYETIFVFGTEEDLLSLRAVAWDDPLYLFPIRVEPEQARAMFSALLERAQEIERRPEFYHTLTNNCTTNLIRPINELVELPVRWRVGIMPGYSFDEAFERGWIDTDLPRDQARASHRVNARVRAAQGAEDFSRELRRPSGLPGG